MEVTFFRCDHFGNGKLPRDNVRASEPPGIDPSKLEDYLKIARFADYAGIFKASFWL